MLNPTKQQNIMEDGRVYADLQVLIKLQHKASGFGFLPRQPIHSLLAGRHASRMRGRGLDFEEIRHHLPGDDIRNMDLKVTARIGKPFSNNAGSCHGSIIASLQAKPPVPKALFCRQMIRA